MSFAIDHIKYQHQLPELKLVGGIAERDEIKVTSLSSFGSPSWDYSEHTKNPNIKASAVTLYWNFKTPNGDTFDAPRYAALNLTFKELMYTMARRPLGRSLTPETLKKKYSSLRKLVRWMLQNDYHCFSDLTETSFKSWITEIVDADSHGVTKITQLSSAKLLWQYRKSLSRTLNFDPLFGRTGFSVSGVTKSDIKEQKYDFIPELVAQDLIRKAVGFIQTKGSAIVSAVVARDRASLDKLKQGKSKAARDRAKTAALQDSDYSNAEVTTLSRQLMTACNIVIVFFTGIRASEALSLEQDRIIQEDGVTWILGEQYKLGNKSRKWMAPDITYEAHQMAKKLSQPMRDAIDWEIEQHHKIATESGVKLDRETKHSLSELRSMRERVFLTWSNKRGVGFKFSHAPQVDNTKNSIHTSLKEFVRVNNVRDEQGNLWNLHTHQFRKTFAKFMAANMMNIRYLQEHMGHLSLDMTAWYDSDDIELTETILGHLKELKKNTISKIFNGQKIAGAASEGFTQEREDYFIGLTSDKQREAFVAELADDVTLRTTGHSWCLGDSSNGNCTGVVGCMMDAGQTTKCKSALITEEHLPAWKDMETRKIEILNSDEVGSLQKQAVTRTLDEVIRPTIAKLEAKVKS
jgi:integrase